MAPAELKADGSKVPPSADLLRRIASILVLPSLVFCAARLLLHGVAIFNGLDPYDLKIWARWDGAHYLDIAVRGYVFFFGGRARYHESGAWQGNAGWMPGYPLVVRLFMFTGLSNIVAGVIVAAMFELLSLIAIWWLFYKCRWSWRNVLGLFIAGFFPGMIYFHATYPISQLNFLVLLCLWLVGRKKWIFAGILGLMITLTYTTGITLAVVLCIWALLGEPGVPWRRRLIHGACAGGLTLAGLGVLMLVQRLSVGYWTAFYMITGDYGYGHSLSNPLRIFFQAVHPLLEDQPLITKVPAMQTLFVALMVVLLCVFVLLNKKRRGIQPEHLFLLFLLVCWSFPLALGRDENLYRPEATLLPAVVLLPRLPTAVLAVMLPVCICLGYWIALLYFADALR